MVTQRTVRQVRRVMLWALTVLLVLLTLGIATSSWRVFGTLASVRAERYEAERERDALRLRNAELQAAVNALDTPRGLEAEIRSRYPLVKPGEYEFVFVDGPEGATSTSAQASSSFWVRMKSYIGF